MNRYFEPLTEAEEEQVTLKLSISFCRVTVAVATIALLLSFAPVEEGAVFYRLSLLSVAFVCMTQVLVMLPQIRSRKQTSEL